MIYIFRESASNGARDLAEALDAKRYKGLRVPIEQKVRAGDVVIAWGQAVGNVPAGVKILNGAPLRNKFEDAVKLKDANVATIDARRDKPAPVPAKDPAVEILLNAQAIAEDFVDIAVDDSVPRNPVMLTGVDTLLRHITQLREVLNAPIPVQDNGEWLPRLSNHVGGNDLLTPPATPHYYVRKENIVEEFRVHSFLGRSIRAGKKVVREGFANPHPWIRSWDGGWRIAYDGDRTSVTWHTVPSRPSGWTSAQWTSA
jgi:hypothetical protein